MKKILLLLLTLTLVFTSALFVSSCSDDKHTHLLTFVEAVDATCTTDGNIAYYHCSECGKNYADEKTKNEISDITIKSIGHDYGTWINEIPAKCKETGVKGHYHCPDCQKNFDIDKNEIENLTITEKGHNYGDWIDEEPKTCTTDGKKGHYCCSDCQKNFDTDKNEIEDLTIKASHTLTFVEAVEATCSADGNVAYYHCSECLKNYSDENATTEINDVVVIKVNHNFVNGFCEDCSQPKYSEGLIFTLLDDDTYSVSKGSFDNTTLIIPSTYNDKTVSIGDYAFQYCSSLTSVTIGNGVTSIGNSAFYGCDSLEKIYYTGDINSWVQISGLDYLMSYGKSSKNLYINGTLLTEANITTATSIYSNAFYNYDKLTKVTIGDQVESIGGLAFYNCKKLTSVTIGNGVTSIGSYAFSGCSSLEYNTYDNAYYLGNDDNPYLLLIKTINTSITSCTINSNTKFIYEGAFRWCSSLTSITIPDNVTNIGYSALYGCSSLKYNTYDNAYYLGNDNNPYLWLIDTINTSITSCTINSNTKFIYSNAFEDCRSLTSITIPNSVASIGGSAFYNCYKLVEIINKCSLNITKGSEDYGYVGHYALYVHNGDSLIKTVGDYQFITYDNVNYLLSYIGNDTEITLPSNYNGENYQIYKYAFYKNTKLTKVTITDSVTSIFEYAFYECSSLTSVTIGNGITDIYGFVFYKCSSLTSVTIGNGVSYISIFAFYNCSLLEYNKYDNAYYLGNDNNPYLWLITAIDTSITSCAINSNTKGIADYAFDGCTSLASITIPDKVTSIGYGTFRKCSSITSVTIPDNVTSIGLSAFSGCDSLTSVTFENTSGWYVTKNSSATSGTNVTVTNSSTNATYLTSTYCDYNWKRS